MRGGKPAAFVCQPWPAVNRTQKRDRQAGVSGVTYGAQWSADLSSGVWTPIADTGTGTTHTFSVPVGGNPQLFLRLTASEP
jgi:hypothetical protein